MKLKRLSTLPEDGLMHWMLAIGKEDELFLKSNENFVFYDTSCTPHKRFEIAYCDSSMKVWEYDTQYSSTSAKAEEPYVLCRDREELLDLPCYIDLIGLGTTPVYDQSKNIIGYIQFVSS